MYQSSPTLLVDQDEVSSKELPRKMMRSHFVEAK